MLDNKALTELVEAVIRRQFSDAVINTVAVKPDVDHDGDDILRVTVVVQDGIERLDPDKAVGLIRHLRPELAEAGIENFPIVSYMTKADAARLNLEPV